MKVNILKPVAANKSQQVGKRKGVSIAPPVHKNSTQPVQLYAQAYTHGNSIHSVPGQQKHVLHEGNPMISPKNKIIQTKTVRVSGGVVQLGKREKRKKALAQKTETQGRRQRFKKQFLESKDPRALKLELQNKYQADELALANIENAWDDSRCEFFPALGINVFIANGTLQETFKEAMHSKKFIDLVKNVLSQLRTITVALHITDTRWNMGSKTIYIKQKGGATKESYLGGLIFEMSNAFHTAEFEEHNVKAKQIVKSKKDGTAGIRFGLTASKMADAMEETEWKSVAKARAIGIEGMASRNWNRDDIPQYAADKGTHMKIQKESGHWQRYFDHTKEIQNRIRQQRANLYTPARLRARFNNDAKLKAKYGEVKVSQAVEQAIVNRTLTDAAVMAIVKVL